MAPASGPAKENNGRIANNNLLDYRKGSITSIRLKNFLTYYDVTITPGPDLNLVMGPNGTGKSSILCAICLGLGGKPSLLGRSDNVGEFVSRDKEKGYIEIELVDRKGNEAFRHVIRREIERGHNRSVWKYQGRPSSQEAVRELVESFKIQIDNLCTFLPQDKVGSFTEHGARERLIEVEKALTKANLLKQHEELIDRQRSTSVQDQRKGSLEGKIEDLSKQNEALEEDVERMRRRETLMKELKEVGALIKWYQLEEQKAVAIALYKEVEQLKKEHEESSGILKPFQEKVEKAKENMKTISKARAKLKEKAAKENEAKDELFKEMEDIAQNIQSQAHNLKNLDKKHADKQKHLEREQQMLVEKRKELAEADSQDLKDELAQVKQQLPGVRQASSRALQQVQEQEQALRSKVEECRRIRSELDGLKDERMQRWDRLRQMHGSREAVEAAKWVDSNRGMFRKAVYGPLALELTIDNDTAAMYLEHHLANWLMLSFVVQCKEDADFIYEEYRRKLRKKISVVQVGGPLRKVRPLSEVTMENLKKNEGVLGYLDEYFQCPDEIYRALMSQAGIDKVIIGNERAEERLKHGLVEKLCPSQAGDPEAGPPGCVLITKYRRGGRECHTYYQIRRSKYSGQASSNSRDIVSTKKVLGKGEDLDKRNRIESAMAKAESEKAAIERDLGPFKQRSQEVKAEYTSLKDRETAIIRKIDKSKDIAIMIKRMEGKIELLQKELSSGIATQKAEIKKKMQDGHLKVMAKLKEAVRKVELIATNEINSSGYIFQETILKRTLRDAEAELRSKRGMFEELENRMKDSMNARKKLEAEIKHAKGVLERQHPLKEGDRPTELGRRSQELPKKVEELREMFENMDAELQATVDNPEVIRQYEERKKEIQKLKDELQVLAENHQSEAEQLEAMAEGWENALDNISQKLNALFSVYMQQMGCQGEIRLHKESNYDQWGLEIQVRFRKTAQLSALCATTHSGGERSVSTILFLMALQELAPSPFRAVDEINQGMDERNERLVFSRIIANCGPKNGKPPSSQYFLITPKLLPKLTAMEQSHVTVLIVFNGPFLLPCNKWNVDNFLNKAEDFRKRKAIGSAPEEEEEEEEEEEPLRRNAGASEKKSKR